MYTCWSCWSVKFKSSSHPVYSRIYDNLYGPIIILSICASTCFKLILSRSESDKLAFLLPRTNSEFGLNKVAFEPFIAVFKRFSCFHGTGGNPIIGFLSNAQGFEGFILRSRRLSACVHAHIYVNMYVSAQQFLMLVMYVCRLMCVYVGMVSVPYA